MKKNCLAFEKCHVEKNLVLLAIDSMTINSEHELQVIEAEVKGLVHGYALGTGDFNTFEDWWTVWEVESEELIDYLEPYYGGSASISIKELCVNLKKKMFEYYEQAMYNDTFEPYLGLTALLASAKKLALVNIK